MGYGGIRVILVEGKKWDHLGKARGIHLDEGEGEEGLWCSARWSKEMDGGEWY